MTVNDDAAKLETLAKLAHSRAEIRRVLEPSPRVAHGERDHEQHDDQPDGGPLREDAFPRSRTMRLLMSGRGLGTFGAMVGGLLMARPALALKLVRMVPAGAVARMLLVKAVTAYRARH